MVTATDQFDDDTPLATDLQQFAYLARTIQSEQSKYVRGTLVCCGSFSTDSAGLSAGKCPLRPESAEAEPGPGALRLAGRL